MTARRTLPLVPILAMVAAGVLVAPSLPEEVPVHWNLAGEPDGWGGRWVGALGLPIVALSVWSFLSVVERFVRRRSGFGPAARRAMDHLQLGMALLWLVIWASSLAPELGYAPPLDPTGVALLAAGLFLAATGVVLRRMAGTEGAEVLVGLPVDDPAAKRDVLRVSGGLLIAGGAMMALGAPFGPDARLGLLLASLAVQAVGHPVYLMLRLARTP